VESKTKDIEHLETSLHSTRNENESFCETLSSASKETRSLKRQLQLLEGGTESALSELSKERDEALSESTDLRKRLELSQKKTRNQEETVDRIQTLWDRDRSTWETQKRAFETKVHIVEGRLKVVLREIANSHMVNGQTMHQDVNHHESPKKMHLRKGSAASIRSIGFAARRRDSEVSSGTQDGDSNGYRLSAAPLTNGQSTSLAEELAFDAEQEDQTEHNVEQEEQMSADELPEERPISVQSRPLDLKARKILGLGPDDQLPVVAENEHHTDSVDANKNVDATMSSKMITKLEALYEVQYVDSAVQYSPPPSPKLSSIEDSPTPTEDDTKTIFFADAVSHQEPEMTLKSIDPNGNPATPSKPSTTMISTSCQTSGQLPSPPWTPLTTHDPALRYSSGSSSFEPQMISTATQTDIIDVEEPEGGKGTANSFQTSLIPTIAIHPPASRPTTPTSNVVLPPHTKNASCQVDIPSLVGYTSSSMQTEEIRVDARAAQLPQKLLPSRKSSQYTDNTIFRKSPALQPASPLPNSSRRRLQHPGSIKPATSRRKAWEPSAEPVLQSPTIEVEEPLTSPQAESFTRNSESSVSVVAPENAARDDGGKPEPKEFDEDDIFSRPTAKFTLRAGKLVSKDEPETNYQDIFDKIDAEANEGEPSVVNNNNSSKEFSGVMSRRSTLGNAPAVRPLERKPRTLRSTSSKQFDIRKAALISSGAAAHQSARDRSPSAPVKPPPFPVPTRHSSRKPPISLSEGAQSPTPNGRSPRKRDGKGRKPGLRKARSATSVTRPVIPGHPRSPSPPLLSSQYDATQDPGLPLPPMPYDDTTPAPGLDYAVTSRRRAPVRQDSHTRTDSASTVLQQTSVVDAIAQTMVGEWMFKYVRRRKSFGVPEPKSQDWDLMRNGDELSATITNTGVRHKRWVWLAPYERAVMWSSKQPTSGSALMGKSGRKCTHKKCP
jgi:Meiotic cell cortex C-terminal pleckstrin homology